MNQREQHDNAEALAASDFIPPIPDMQRIEEEITAARSELLRHFQDTTQFWIGRMQAEADLVSELSTKLASARTLPDTATSLQECTKRQMELLAEDTKRLLDDSQKFTEMTARLFSQNWLSTGRGGGS
jgi:hypothetical protein